MCLTVNLCDLIDTKLNAIRYPEISKYIQLLHAKHISVSQSGRHVASADSCFRLSLSLTRNSLYGQNHETTAVSNCYLQEPLRTIPPVTQLYLSIDAGDKVALKAIDRPLHRDFWERLLECVEIVKDNPYRTVFRQVFG